MPRFLFLKLRGILILKIKIPVPVVEPKKQQLTILAFGDMMLDRMVFAKTQKTGDFNFPFSNIDEFLKTADIKFANLEGPITDFKSVSNGNTQDAFYDFSGFFADTARSF